MESAENDRTVFRPSHKTLKIDETDFHIPTATTTTEQSFHSKPEKPVQTNGAAAMHPEDVLTMHEAVSLFSICQSMIESLISDLEARELIEKKP